MKQQLLLQSPYFLSNLHKYLLQNSKVKMYLNGISISNTVYSWTGTTLTYVPANKWRIYNNGIG